MRILSCLVLLAVGAAPGAPAAADLAARVAAVERPAVAGRMASPPSLAVGRAEIVPQPGTAAYVLADGEGRIGVLLAGPVHLVYRVDDRFSAPVARRNLRHASGVAVAVEGEGLVVTASLQGAAVWGDGLVPVDAPLGPADGVALPPWLTRVLERKLTGNPARDLLLARDNGGAPYRWALLDTGADLLVLDVDPRPTVAAESLLRLERIDLRSEILVGRLTMQELVTQPVGRAWADGTAVDVEAVETTIDLENPVGEAAVITTTTRLVAKRDGLRLVGLALIDGRWDDRERFRELRLADLRVDGEPADVARLRGGVLVALPRTLRRGESVVVTARTEGDILFRPGNNSYWRLGAYPWYPRPYGGEERASFRISVAVPAPFVPVAPGHEVERRAEGGLNRVRTELAGPTSIVEVLAGRYELLVEEEQGLRVEVASYAMSKGEEARLAARNVMAIEACLEQWLATPSPFPDVKVVEVAQWGWGEAPAGLILVTGEHFLNAASAKVGANRRSTVRRVIEGAGERLAHEVAHGWFPHRVWLHDGEEAWLSESFAEYTATVCIERATADAREARRAFERQLVDWRKQTSFLGDGASIYLAGHFAGAGDEDARDRRYLLYGKGPLVLHALRQELGRRHGAAEGDRFFFAWFRAIVRASANRYTTTRDTVGILDALTGESWMPWFERYVYGTETPPVE